MKKLKHVKVQVYLMILFIALPVCAISQDSICKFSPHWFIKTNLGVSYGNSDLAENTNVLHCPDIENIKPGIDLGLGRQLSPCIGLSADFYLGTVEDQNEGSDHFKSALFDYSLSAIINCNKLISPLADHRLNFWASAGIGQLQFKTKVDDVRGRTLYGYEESMGALRGSGYNGRRIVMVFPISLGLDFKLSDRYFLNLKYKLKITGTDLIDGKLEDGNNDSYNFISFGIRYNFLKSKKIESKEVLD